MFAGLTRGMSKAFDLLAGKKIIREDDIKEVISSIRTALLEADVSLDVVEEFCQKVKEKALGEQVIKSVTPAQMFIKIVQDEITELLEPKEQEIRFSDYDVTVILLAGLQGTGKTTSSAKLAKFIKDTKKKNVLVASLDAYRPAAKEQLAIMAEKAGVDSLEIDVKEKPEKTAKRALKTAEKKGYDVLILDSAGRLSIDKELISELKKVQKIAAPDYTYLVADSLSGQDAITTATNFNQEIKLNGLIMTRMDGDTRGGAVLSMKYVTNLPIIFSGTGEKIEDLSYFSADRIAKRLLDMGDIVSLVEKAQEAIDEKEAFGMEAKIKSGKFDLNDLLKQIRTMKKMGGFSSLLGMLPGASKLKDAFSDNKINENQITEQESVILSMTAWERENPDKLSTSRKRRIAAGSGTSVQVVNRLLKRFKEIQKMLKKFGNMDQGEMENMFNAVNQGHSLPVGMQIPNMNKLK